MALRSLPLLFALAAVAAACAHSQATPAAPPPGLWGTAWRLEDFGGSPVLEGTAPTLQFPEQGKVSGNGSCNRFFGKVEISGESIKLGALGLTRMSCSPAIGAQERKYLETLEAAERFVLQGSVLSIYSKGMDRPLRFRKAGP